jgi:hypothetical protein
MHEQQGWARREGKDELQKRRTVVITIPKGRIQ